MTKSTGGTFPSMNLCKPVLKGIYKKGYTKPTPIQRKAIPTILNGQDVVAMARTGSGKTAAFLIPIIQKLQSHKIEKGARALILSPTRELALQTYKFAKEFARFTDLKCETILGGDSMERQFEKIHENPDILIATPGRLLHIAIEMNLKFSAIEMVVFDEADRLFEMGFKDQLMEILSRLPSNKQTLLFSATLPQMIIDFTKAGLTDPVLIRLDIDMKLNENLKLIHLQCRNEDKLAILLFLIKKIINSNEQTIVFMPTRHHIEYVHEILDKCSIESTYLYSSLDSEARKLNIRKFYLKKVHILLVTDLAARGVDIPLLDNVINFNFPTNSKLFLHRIGRTARAGNSGCAYSLISSDELPYLFQLNLFLNQDFKLAKSAIDNNENDINENIYGTVPQTIIDEQNDIIKKLHQNIFELDSMKNVCEKAYKQYWKTKSIVDNESIRKMKEFIKSEGSTIGYHPIFIKQFDNEDLGSENERIKMLNSIKSYKPNANIFEVNRMKNKSKALKNPVDNKRNELISEDSKKKNFKDDSFYIEHQANNYQYEKQLQLQSSFDVELKQSIIDFNGDEKGQIGKNRNQLKWDRKRKKFTTGDESAKKIKKIRTENGNWINESYNTGIYEKWKKKWKIDSNENVSNMEMSKQRKKSKNSKQQKRPIKRELKTKDEIFKERKRLERIQTHQKQRKKAKNQKMKKSKR